MNPQIVKERLSQVPFRPLSVETVGGTWIDVETEDDVLVARTGPVRIVIFDSSTERLFILGPEQISAIESK